MTTPSFAVVLVNLGTPNEPTPVSVRRFLAEFLADKRVIDAPRWLWLCILHGIILRIRPARVAKLYQSIWSAEGSPMRAIGEAQATLLARHFSTQLGESIPVRLAMTYGQPSLNEVLASFTRRKVSRIVILPLYPQYSSTTTAAVYDAMARYFATQKVIPQHCFVDQYATHAGYITALASSVQQHWQQHGQAERLVMSFHGIPQRYADEGDPYPQQCQQTAEALASMLGLSPEQWIMTFQSRFGPAQWVQPYTDETLTCLAKEGVKQVDVICPAFAADCLETLEEIAEENKDIFLQAGGESYRYIPALNTMPEHIEALAEIVLAQAKGWC